jgi:hypothetical protein
MSAPMPAVQSPERTVDWVLVELGTALELAIAARRRGDEEWLAEAIKRLDRAWHEFERVRGRR